MEFFASLDAIGTGYANMIAAADLAEMGRSWIIG
jgi:hypothetical protein